MTWDFISVARKLNSDFSSYLQPSVLLLLLTSVICNITYQTSEFQTEYCDIELSCLSNYLEASHLCIFPESAFVVLGLVLQESGWISIWTVLTIVRLESLLNVRSSFSECTGKIHIGYIGYQSKGKYKLRIVCILRILTH